MKDEARDGCLYTVGTGVERSDEKIKIFSSFKAALEKAKERTFPWTSPGCRKAEVFEATPEASWSIRADICLSKTGGYHVLEISSLEQIKEWEDSLDWEEDDGPCEVAE